MTCYSGFCVLNRAAAPWPHVVTLSCSLCLPSLKSPRRALLLDLDAFDANLTLMADRVKQSGKHLRPHAKAHKCVEIARRQIAAGAIGVCVATVAEAELMSGAGIGGLLLTSPLADPLKMARVDRHRRDGGGRSCHSGGLVQRAARSADRTVDVAYRSGRRRSSHRSRFHCNKPSKSPRPSAKPAICAFADCRVIR